MLLSLLVAAPFAFAAPAVFPRDPAPAVQASGIDWFPGPLFAIKAKAERENKGVFIVAYTEESSWCDKLFQSTFEDTGVQTELEGLLCIKVNLTRDSDGVVMDKNAERIASRFPVLSFPTILYLGTNLKPEDMISGFIPGPALQVELQRMKAGTNTLSDLRSKVQATPRDIEAIWALASKCQDFGYTAENRDLIKMINKLDPKGVSRPLRQERLLMMQERLFREYTETGKYDHVSITRFLKYETNPTVAFQGWSQLGGLVRTFRPKLTSKKEKKAMGALSRECYGEAWKVIDPTNNLNFAVQVLNDLFQDRKELTGKDRKLATTVMASLKESIKGRNDTPAVQAIFHDAQACAAYVTKKKDLALQEIDEALRLDPTNPQYVKRKQDLMAAKK